MEKWKHFQSVSAKTVFQKCALKETSKVPLELTCKKFET